MTFNIYLDIDKLSNIINRKLFQFFYSRKKFRFEKESKKIGYTKRNTENFPHPNHFMSSASSINATDDLRNFVLIIIVIKYLQFFLSFLHVH